MIIYTQNFTALGEILLAKRGKCVLFVLRYAKRESIKSALVNFVAGKRKPKRKERKIAMQTTSEI